MIFRANASKFEFLPQFSSISTKSLPFPRRCAVISAKQKGDSIPLAAHSTASAAQHQRLPGVKRAGAARALTWVRRQTRSIWRISESQNLKRESKSLTQRADFASRAYTASRFFSSSLYSVVEPMQRRGIAATQKKVCKAVLDSSRLLKTKFEKFSKPMSTRQTN